MTNKRSSGATVLAPLLLASTLTGFFATSLTPSPAWADGTILYASPSGSGSECTTGTPCSLAEALSNAPDGSTIDLDAGTYQPGGDTSFTISTSLTMQPTVPGSSVVLDGSPPSDPESIGAAVVLVDADTTVTLSNVTIEGGRHRAGPGGIDNGGTLTLVDTTVDHNFDTGSGAGISSSGSLTLISSTVSYNASSGEGGAIDARGSLTLYDSTVADNSNDEPSGGNYCTLCAGSGPTTIDDSTLDTGWVEASGPMTVESSTIVGANLSAEPVSLAADLLVKPSGSSLPNCQVGNGFSVVDDGFNIDDDGSCGFSAANDSVSDSASLDDYLGSLSANGGPTETVPLLSIPSPFTSSPDPAVNLIPSTFNLPVAVNGQTLVCSQPDQRGTTRNQPCDVGAFELTSDPPAATAEVAAPVLFPSVALLLAGISYVIYRRRSRGSTSTSA
jgi:hypothetical protein